MYQTHEFKCLMHNSLIYLSKIIRHIILKIKSTKLKFEKRPIKEKETKYES